VQHLIKPGSVRHRGILPSNLVLHFIHLSILIVDRRDHVVVRNVVQMTSELEPGSSSTNMVSGTLASGLQDTVQRGLVLARTELIY